MTLNYFRYELHFKQPFSIAHGTRTGTDAVYVIIEHENFKGYGEASFPPYLAETAAEAILFFKQVDLSPFTSPADALNYMHQLKPDNYGAKAALDMALMDIIGKQHQMPLQQLWKLNSEKIPTALFTIGMGTPKKIMEDVIHSDAEMFKVKLGGPFDKQIIETICAVTDKPFCVDANQGWPDVEFTIDMIAWLKEKGCVFVEQPLPKNDFDAQQKVFEKSVLPVIADETLQTIADLNSVKELFHGINVKLMKCGGLSKAKELIEAAGKFNLKIVIGCMSEGSCACSAAAQLAPLANWLDLDGPLLINNDLFDGIKYENGKLILPESDGIGAVTKAGFENYYNK